MTTGCGLVALRTQPIRSVAITAGLRRPTEGLRWGRTEGLGEMACGTKGVEGGFRVSGDIVGFSVCSSVSVFLFGVSSVSSLCSAVVSVISTVNTSNLFGVCSSIKGGGSGD